ncbi:GrpB family protein [Ureibacillus chungkukjangi]|uniref:GrpB family protein n=2 Tax=Ureibacillus chungkukjangi TaxID=1202712 RepID=UPI00203BFBDC|nr:GrpB family protein [Ureibacillus chungkukjangi]MCM3390622.1 GrpB family protein [Ureibacillus chungkukjangi]
MKLGLKNNEVVIVPFDKEWKDEFNKTKTEIIQNTNLTPTQIEHIGSTSIEGIRAKPIIDILIGVDSLTTLDKAFFKDLQNIGFYRLKVERPNEIVCAKFTDETFEIKTHFIHIVEFEKEKWNQMLFFRDYLNINQDIKEQYENLKESFFSTDLKGINSYTDYKEQFVQSIFERMTSK